MPTQVFLVSHNHFLNSALQKILREEMEINCQIWAPESLFSFSEKHAQHHLDETCLLLVDYAGFVFQDLRASLWGYLNYGPNSHWLAALFNVPRNAGIEHQMLEIGVQGIFYDDYELDLFRKGVSNLFHGELWYSRNTLSKYVQDHPPKRPPPAPDESTDSSHLTRREEEILILISLGKSNAQIAEDLFISPSTVKTHVYNIFQKINVPNRIQAALWTVKHLSHHKDVHSET